MTTTLVTWLLTVLTSNLSGRTAKSSIALQNALYLSLKGVVPQIPTIFVPDVDRRPIKNISLSVSLWSSCIKVHIVVHQRQNLKPQNHFTSA